MIAKLKTRKAKKQQSKAYLKRKAQLYEKWSKKTPSLDELIEDLEWSVGIKS